MEPAPHLTDKYLTVIDDSGFSIPTVANGRMLPVLILDCAERTDINDLILIHKDTPPGDGIVRWGWDSCNEEFVYLAIDFTKPVKTHLCIRFITKSQGILVDCIIHNKAFYLQSSTFGVNVKEIYGKPSVLVEVPATALFPDWESRYKKSIIESCMERGFSRQLAQDACEKLINKTRTKWFRPQGQSVEDYISSFK